MPATSRLGRQLEEALSALQAAGLPVALIGGLALAPHNVVRATQDFDFLADGDNADAIDAVVVALGYTSIYRSDDAANFLRGDERPLATEGGRFVPRPSPGDAFGALDDLMTVIEALCPKWPARPPTSSKSSFVL